MQYAEDMTSPLLLTAISEADTDFVAELAADKRVTAYIGDGQPWSRAYCEQRVAHVLESPGISWFIAWHDKIRIGLFTATQRAGATEIGYWLAPEFWGQGLAKGLVALGIRQLEKAGITDLIARVAPDNAASLKVLERQGFLLQSQDASLLTLTKAARPL